jgi:DNA-binding response OmpR family regulator
MARILVVDDEPEALGSIGRVLEDAGYAVTTASGGQEALEILSRDRPDLVVLDIIMPGMDGLEVCRRIRADPLLTRLPVIFLTARSRSTDIAQGLDIGGDDYVTKPFEVIELPARVRALLRRSPGGVLDVASELVTVGDLRLHVTRFEAWIGERHVTLTAMEHRLLHYLMLRAGQPVSIERLLEDVWEYHPGMGDPALVYAHVANLRSKIEMDPDQPQYIRNVRGRGYVVST